VPEGIPQRLSRYPVDFIPQDRMQVLRRTFHFHRKSRRFLILNCFGPGPFADPTPQ